MESKAENLAVRAELIADQVVSMVDRTPFLPGEVKKALQDLAYLVEDIARETERNAAMLDMGLDLDLDGPI